MRLLSAGCVNAQRHFGRHSLPLLLKALASLCTKSQSQLSLKAARLLQVALGVISSFTPFMLRDSRKLAACAGCVFSPLAPRPCVSMLFKAILVGKISFVTVFESSRSPSSRFGGNPAVHSLHAEKFQEPCCLCWMRLLSSCSTPLQVSAVCVNATLLNDALGDMGSLHSSKPSHPYGQDLSYNYF